MATSRSARRPARIGGALAVSVALGLILGIVGAAVTTPAGSVTPAAATSTPDPTADRVAAPTPPTPPSTQFTLVAAGDVLPHGPVVASATTGSGIDFSPLTAAVKPYIEGADLALCHMEVPVAPPGTQPSGYPRFAGPPELVTDLQQDGWDGCSTASNHSVDRGADGIKATLDAFQAAGMGATGTARTEQEAATIQYYIVHGYGGDVKVAHISYAYGLNGLPKPAGEPWAVNTFDADTANVDPILAAAQQARDEGADVVITSVHCCVEYRIAPTDAQRLIAERIAASGLVDLYIGHHAHVPQPIEQLPGGPDGNGMWVAFGLGNFISNQDASCCTSDTTSGVLLTATFTVDPDGTVTVDPTWTPITVDRFDGHKVYALPDIAAGVGRLSASEVATRTAAVAGAVGPQAPERTTPAEHLARGVDMVPRTP